MKFMQLVAAVPARFAIARRPKRETAPRCREWAIDAGDQQTYLHREDIIRKCIGVLITTPGHGEMVVRLLDCNVLIYLAHYRQPRIPRRLGNKVQHKRIADLVDDNGSGRSIEDRYRFKVHDLPVLMEALDLDGDVHVTTGRYKYNNEEGVLMWLFYFAKSGMDLASMSSEFGGSTSRTSAIIVTISHRIHERWKHRIIGNDLSHMEPLLTTHAEAFISKIGGVANLPGHVGRPCLLMDCQCDPICRPTGSPGWDLQREVYSGHKKYHCLKWLVLGRLDGIVESLHGPVCGRRADPYCVGVSRMQERFSAMRLRVFNSEYAGVNALPFFKIYADGAFSQTDTVGRTHKKPFLPGQKEENDVMKGPRVSIEHMIGKPIQIFHNIYCKENSKILASPVAVHYIVGHLMTNAHSCFYGNQTHRAFNLPRPNIFDYFS